MANMRLGAGDAQMAEIGAFPEIVGDLITIRTGFGRSKNGSGCFELEANSAATLG